MLNFLVRSEIQRVRGAIAEKVGSKSTSLISIFGSPAMFSYCRADNCSFIVESETSIIVGECRVEYSWSWRLRRGLLFSDWTWRTVDAEKALRLEACIAMALSSSKVRGKTLSARDLPEPWVYFGSQYFPSSLVMKTPGLYFGGNEFACNVARILQGIEMWSPPAG
jgi:hypothetical protein